MNDTPAIDDRSTHPTPSGPGETPPDDRSFERLFAREWSGLVALGWSLTGDWARSEEVVQDAFADAYRRWAEIGALDRPGAWVQRAVINRTTSHHRRGAVARRGLARLEGRASVDIDTSWADRTGDRAADNVGDPAFWAAVRALPDRQRACVALHYLEELSVAEIARVLDARPGTVKTHLHRGRRALAAALPERTDDTDVPRGGEDQ